MKTSVIQYCHLPRLYVFCFFVLGLFVSSVAFSQSSYSFEIQGGTAANVPLPLVIRQTGQPDYSFTAKYRTRPFENPYYYEARLSRWHANRSWELEFIHHKIYLDNTNVDVPAFSISHGFNMLMVNRGIEINGNIFRAGLGMVIAHPEFSIRGVSFDQTRGWFGHGYMPSGLAINVGYARHLAITDRFFVNVEAKTTFGYVRLNQDDISVDTYNWAFHLIFGPGYHFLKTRR